MFQTFNFNEFLFHTILPEMQLKSENQRIIRRRIAILLAKWMPMGVSPGNQSTVYEIFTQLLDPSEPMNDQVVRISAGKRLGDVVNDFTFHKSAFEPYAAKMLSRFIALIHEVNLSEHKSALLDTLGLIVNSMEENVHSFLNEVVSLLSPLWDQAGDEFLMKQKIIGVLASLVDSMGVHSTLLLSVVLPIVKSALQPGTQSFLFLLEDALDLFYSIVSNIPAPPPPQIVALTVQLFPIFEMESQLIEKAVRIVDAMVVLSPAEMLSDQIRPNLLKAVASLYNQPKAQIHDNATRILENVIRVADAIQGKL